MTIKKLLRMNFEALKNMSIPELTLYKKWQEINAKTWTTEEKQRIWEVGMSLWTPKEPDDYKKLDVGIIPVENKVDSLTWTIIRVFTSTMSWNQSVGRIGRYIIWDRKTKTYLGSLSLASDFISLSPRDSHIGWTFEQRTKNKMLNYTGMGSSIIPTQPLGYNYVGGKLITLCLCSDKIVDNWNLKYKEPLVAITTTSLYGGFSQYNNLKYWKKCGTTEGKIPLEPTDDVYYEIREWVREKYPNDFKKMTSNEEKVLSRPKSKMLAFAYTKLGIKPPDNNAPRGVYFCKLYKNSNEFLSQKETVLGEKLFDNRLEVLVDLWKTRYAERRVSSLLKDNRYNKNTLYYDDLIGIEWGKAREKYILEVGR
jgi:hypothetical protein